MTEHSRLRVLILCTGNSARSQMAEAILRHLSHGEIDVMSAGSDPAPAVHPMARVALVKLGISATGLHPKSWNQFMTQPFDYVITVCDHAAERCPLFSGKAERLHWSLVDPAAVAGTTEDRQRAFDQTAAHLVDRLGPWLSTPPVAARMSDRGA
jgi:protein-tyrosine-phosphatase